MTSEPLPSATPSLSSRGVLLVLAALPMVFATGFSSYEMLRHEVLLVLSALLLALWGVETLKRRAFGALSLSTLLPLTALAVWAAISSLWSPAPLYGLVDSSLWLALVALSVPLALPSGGRIDWRQLFAAASLGTLGAATWGALDAAGVELFTAVFDPAGATGAFDAAEFGVAYYTVALPLSVALCSARPHGYKALGLLATLAGSAHLAALGSSWMALAALAAGLVIPAAALLLHRDRLKQTLRPAGLVAATVVLLAAGLGAAQVELTDSLYNPAASLPQVDKAEVGFAPEATLRGKARDARMALPRTESLADPQAHDYLDAISLKAAKDRPLVGQGAGGWWLAQSRFIALDHPFTRARFDHYPAFRSTHNGYAKIFIEYGVLGILLLFALFFAAIAAFSQAARREHVAAAVEASAAPLPLDHRDVHALWGLGATLLAAAVIMLSTSVIELAAPMALFAVALVTLGGYATRATRATAQDEDRALAATAPVKRSIAAPLAGVALAAGLVTLGTLELTAGYLSGKADQMMLYGRYEQAGQIYLDAHRLSPGRGELAYNHVLAAWRMGDVQQTEAALAEALALRPDDARVHHLKGAWHLGRKEYKKVVEAEQAAIARFPTYLEAYNNLIVAYDMQLQFDRVTETIDTALSLNPPDRQRAALHTRAGDFYSGPLNNPAKAVAHYKKALSLISDVSTRQRLQTKIVEYTKQVERETLAGQGKPVPSELLPKPQVDDHNHALDFLNPPGLPPHGDHEGHEAGSHDGHEH